MEIEVFATCKCNKKNQNVAQASKCETMVDEISFVRYEIYFKYRLHEFDRMRSLEIEYMENEMYLRNNVHNISQTIIFMVFSFIYSRFGFYSFFFLLLLYFHNSVHILLRYTIFVESKRRNLISMWKITANNKFIVPSRDLVNTSTTLEKKKRISLSYFAFIP